ncbi:MAG: hypothetical protein ACLFPN_05215 [Methanomassiliicoccales archaeon]
MITIKCQRCGAKVFRYVKIGKGKVLRCYKDRIEKDHSVRKGEEVTCACGNVIGRDRGRWIDMDQSAFRYTGTPIKR